MAPQSVLIRGGRVIDPASGLDAIADVAITGQTIAAVGPDLPTSGAETVIDATDRIVCPGLIDPHVHLREPGGDAQETIATGTLAALAGGFTTVCSMPNTQPPPDTEDRVRSLLARIAETTHCRVFPVAAASIDRKGERLTDIPALVRAGAIGVSDDGDALWREDLMAGALRACRSANVAFMQHCQDPTRTVGAAMNDGAVAMRLGLTGWPDTAESSVIERDVAFAMQLGARYHAQHVSSARSIPFLEHARARSHDITAEASPHHLHLTEDACDHYNTGAKVNPPLRTSADVRAIREAVADNIITVLATDHAPHTADAKSRPFDQAPFGLIGLESALPLYAEALVHTGLLSWPRLIERLTVNPARLCNLEQLGLGALTVGGPADVTIIDPGHRWTLTRDTLAGRSWNTPFLGRSLTGRATHAIVAGSVHEIARLRAGQAPAPLKTR
ncbi:MAG: dihydroorotase [Phycisphaeraceae bacterium]|nr:dihydroorotase [Phycisphaeraceae bacterium]